MFQRAEEKAVANIEHVSCARTQLAWTVKMLARVYDLLLLGLFGFHLAQDCVH